MVNTVFVFCLLVQSPAKSSTEVFKDPFVPAVMALTIRDALEVEIRLRSKTLTGQEAQKIASIIYDEAMRSGHSPFLFLAVIYIESYFDHLAVSSAGAEGLMQLMPDTAKQVAEEHNIVFNEGSNFNPETNVRLGILYLEELLKTFPKMEAALTAYNRGPKSTWKLLKENKRKLPQSVIDFYAKPVIDRKKKYDKIYTDLSKEIVSR